MEQNYLIFMISELLIFCIVLYLLIRMNIFVNTLQREVNDLYVYLPVTIRDIKGDLKSFNEFIRKNSCQKALHPQEIGFLAGQIFSEIMFARFSMFPFKRKMILTSIIFKLWKMRERLKVTFLNMFFKII